MPGDLIEFYLALDPKRFGIVIDKFYEDRGFGDFKRSVTFYQVLSSSGVLIINDMDWFIARENLII